MTDKFQHKYRIPSARASWWNYANNAGYFITICTKNRVHYFGDIVETRCIASLQPTEIGKIAESQWLKTPSIRPDMNLELDEFVVMPNHFHAIIWIGDNEYNRDDMVETRCIASLPIQPPQNHNFGPQSKNLSSIMRGYKSSVTMFARKNNIEFEWQERFYDIIIRDEESYQRIKNYIIHNPSNWNTDKYNT
jgi:REP element-mobilizing transposase RayT